MKKDFDTLLLDLDGKTMPMRDDKGQPLASGEQVKVSRPIVNALIADMPGPHGQPIEGEEKAKRYALALKVNRGGEQEITIDDAALIKRVVGQIMPPLTVGRVYEFLEAEG